KINAIGSVTKNFHDGEKIEIVWENTNEKEIIGTSYRKTIAKVSRANIEHILRKFYDKENKTDDEILSENFVENIDQVERVTFYDGYTYGQFVGSYKPISVLEKNNDGEEYGKKIINYEYVSGPLLRQMVKAYKDTKNNFLLIIEEINRAKADRVFGNTFQLLDRDETGESEYTITLSEDQKIYLKSELGDKYYQIEESGLYFPDNFYIWATMNSADQGVYPMDTAFKRRWNFEYIPLDDGEEFCKNFEIEINLNGEMKNIKWNSFRKSVNNILENSVPEDRLLAPFFIKENDFKFENNHDENNYGNIFLNKVMMYLFDDVLRHKNKNILFDENIKSFSNLVKTYKNNGNIFVKEFVEKVLEQEKQNAE
ncbi:MAG: AAA family ATPase, partial [Fusobacteriaceae bacterium]